MLEQLAEMPEALRLVRAVAAVVAPMEVELV